MRIFVVIVAAVLVIFVFGFALDREDPKELEMAAREAKIKELEAAADKNIKDLSLIPEVIISSYNISAVAGKILPRATFIKKSGNMYEYQLTSFSLLNIETKANNNAIGIVFLGGGDGSKDAATIALLSAVTFVMSLHPTIDTSTLKQLGLTNGAMTDGKERIVNVLDMKITSILAKNMGLVITVLPTN